MMDHELEIWCADTILKLMMAGDRLNLLYSNTVEGLAAKSEWRTVTTEIEKTLITGASTELREAIAKARGE